MNYDFYDYSLFLLSSNGLLIYNYTDIECNNIQVKTNR